jgi:hypothetical protein
MKDSARVARPNYSRACPVWGMIGNSVRSGQCRGHGYLDGRRLAAV